MKIHNAILLSLLLAVTASAQYQKPMLGELPDWSGPPNLVGCWLLNEGAGSIVNDASGNGNSGVFVAGTSWTSGPHGPAVLCDGSDDYVTFGDAAVFDGHTAMTWSCWVKFTDVTGNDSFWGKYTATTGKRSWDLGLNGNDVYIYLSANGSSGEVKQYTNSNLSAEVWYHIVFTFDAGAGTLYLNGQWVQSIAHTPTSIYAGSEVMTFGTGLAGVTACTGSSLSLWSRALTPPEVARLYRKPFAGSQRERPELCVSAGGGEPPAVGRVQVIFISGIPVWVSLALVGACVWDMKQRRAAA